MKTIGESFLRRVFTDQRGQTVIFVLLGMTALLGVGGLTMDVGNAYVARRQLQSSVNAAALAASGEVFNANTTNNATAVATQYAALNNNSSLGTVTTKVSTVCLNVLMKGSSCSASGNVANAVKVTQSAAVPTHFMRLFGVNTLTVASTATASMQGVAHPWNVVIILDATGSMAIPDSNCGGVSEFQCAMNGIQALLSSTNPCAVASGCNFRVALFSFPAVSIATVADQYGSGGGGGGWGGGWGGGGWGGGGNTPTFMEYTLPLTNATSYTPLTYTEGTQTWTATYNMLYKASDADANGFVDDYYKPSASNGLNPSSSIVKAITGSMQPMTTFSQTGPGNLSINNCSGGNGCTNGYDAGVTYYASAIYAAQAALVAEQAANPGSQNAIIFLSDGQANLVSAYFAPGTSPASSISPNLGYQTLTGTGLYPDSKDECQQAIMAAQAATAAGTTVYGVAYGSEQTGCATAASGGGAYTDTTLVATGKNASFTLSNLSPCVTIENIASSFSTFYSDYKQSGTGVDLSCVDNSHTVSSLNGIFYSIGATFTNPRLLPNNAT